MKKIQIFIIILVLIVMLLPIQSLAVQTKNTTEKNTTSTLMQNKEKTKNKMDKYIEKYGSEGFGTTAYILNIVRIYSIPFCFIGIAVGALYQYVLGTRRLDSKHKGFGLIIMFATLLVISQVLPLIFAIVVKGWGD